MNAKLHKLFVCFLSLIMALTLTFGPIGFQSARAASLVVDSAADTIANDGACTLREAITNANANDQSGSTDCAAGSGADAITFAADYTITLDGSQLPVITSEITVTGNGAANTIIQANANPNMATYRVLEISAAGNLTLDGVTVRNGKASSGGGIRNEGTATITTSTISGNTADFGGGIRNEGTATITITASTISGNTADYGGGIRNAGTVTITASTISGNTADYGGGIFNVGTATINASTISGNTADYSGGGIYNSGTATITASTISGNTAYSSGGISNGASLSVTNSTLAGNSATVDGGGAITNWLSSTTTLTNVTISGNASASQAAVWNQSGTLNLTNTIIANSTGAADCQNDDTLGTNTNNLVEDNTCSPALDGDPMLGSLANNGGDTQTLALLAGSPAIDAGTNVGCPATDQRGETRPQGAQCDMGAYEADGHTVTFDANGGSGSMSPQTSALPAALTLNAFTRAGYTFAGWNTNADGSGTTYTDGATYSFAADATLYAQWNVPPNQMDTFYSMSGYDGTIFETNETSGIGTVPNVPGATLDVGDHLLDRQTLAIVHFDTSSLPDNAVVTGVTLLLKRSSFLGVNPFTTHGDLQVDIASPFFGPEIFLKPGDFEAAAGAASVGIFNPVAQPGNWYEAALNAPAFAHLNLFGSTQLRLRFSLDDNDDMGADLVRFFSGNHVIPSYRPTLIVEYYVP